MATNIQDGLTDAQMNQLEASQPSSATPPATASPTAAASPQPIDPDNPPSEMTDEQMSALEAQNQHASDIQDKYGTPGQVAATAAESAVHGAFGPLATGAELLASKAGVPGMSAADIAGRNEANPWTHDISEGAGMLGGIFTGNTEAAGVVKAAELLADSAKLGKFGSTVLKAGIEGGLFSGGDEISKAMLGQGDPNTPVASALAHMGTTGLMTAATGGALSLGGKGVASTLGAAADTKIGQKASQLLEDFGNRWKFKQENPDLASAIKDELSSYHASTSAAADEVYGPTGLKAQAIQKLVPPMNEDISAQTGKLADILQAKYANMLQDPETYPPRLTKKLSSDINNWMETATNPKASSMDQFNATQDLKQKMQAYAKFDKQVTPLSGEQDFVNSAKDIAHTLRESLEDQSVWGKAGQLQQGVNKAFTDFLPAQKDFLSKFTEKVEGEPTISPGKIQTYVNQLGKPSAEIKQSMLKNYVDAAEQYRSKITSLHNNLGLESPLQPASLNAVNGTLDKTPSAGSKFADLLYKIGPASAGTIGSGVVGAAVNHIAGPVAGFSAMAAAKPWLERTVGHPLTDAGASFMLQALSRGNTDNLSSALQHVGNMRRGAGAIKNSVNSLFGVGKAATQEMQQNKNAVSDREKLKKFIANGTLQQQMQQGAAPTQTPQPSGTSSPQNFAAGGTVQPSNVLQPTLPQAQPSSEKDISSGVSSHFPDQYAALNTAKGRINQYLTSLQPQNNPTKLPYDKSHNDADVSRKYDRALDIANKPLSVLDHIKKGTITPEGMQHFTSMYPELHAHLKNKITEKITEGQVKGEMPPYKVRQGMSLFMGSPLDSTFTQQGIALAQPSPSAPPPQAHDGTMKKKNKGESLKKLPNQYKTAAQDAESDRSSRD